MWQCQECSRTFEQEVVYHLPPKDYKRHHHPFPLADPGCTGKVVLMEEDQNMDDMTVYRALTERQGSTGCELARIMKRDVVTVALVLTRLFGNNVIDKMLAQYCLICGKKETTWWAKRSPFKRVEMKYDDTPTANDRTDDRQGEDEMSTMVE